MGMSTKIVVVLREGLEPALAANAGVVLGLALGGRMENSLAADGKDAGGGLHAGLNPHPVPTLVASAEQLRALKAGADERDLTVVGFNEVARRSRDYVEYLDALAVTEPQDVEYVGVAVFGARNAVNKLTGKLALMR
ncbi:MULTISPECIES: DUF2000 domain-containing protein [Nocardiopsis]|uniref:DUF2000 domain-containing protein n=1 Tax=Nocardiopsis dassonvillei (strain ATCC 23218 / DSM 43111 / CIP 107115 / JCM 7437 / KCTC 9190 / NBRC 14626 / NCTC 10488 / NRRL B-5397 / IMRU 509) TaxID=446468 RepID=D7AUK0_NOCDD|nr:MULTISPECIES: DUF2000 domain-containing protein [Nocardiopsis]ADH67580.1 Protein of unknown function DUF2000 [Nocardiopsis dassonvillei subsp. dassonvillei DSM 43111]APC35769.1 hypothetical protein A9R04_14235 [Nocardiopsis dassonvillei]NKY77582.1 DUF2000 domain-containing protein [Nocardiopsis dassonvillei]VEI87919.1 Uncharacterized protein conserved in bacteria [Nocardiopsis dassonvillei]